MKIFHFFLKTFIFLSESLFFVGKSSFYLPKNEASSKFSEEINLGEPVMR